MAPNRPHSGRTGPKVGLKPVTLPPGIARGLADIYGTDNVVDTATADTLDRQPTPENLWRAADGDRVFGPSGEGSPQAYVSVLAPLI